MERHACYTLRSFCSILNMFQETSAGISVKMVTGILLLSISCVIYQSSKLKLEEKLRTGEFFVQQPDGIGNERALKSLLRYEDLSCNIQIALVYL